MPTYNRADVVLRAVDSVLSQTVRDFEMIIVDDGSTDGSWEILNAINDHRVRVERNVRTKGAPGARNTGIYLAMGSWVCAIDSDDLWDRDFLKHLKQGVSRAGEKVGIVHGSVTFVENGRQTRVRRAEASGMTYPRMLHEHFFYHTASAFRTSILRELGGYDESLADGEDTDMQLRITECCEMLPVPDAMYFYDRSPNPERMTRDHAGSARSKKRFLKKHALLYKAHPGARFSFTNEALKSAILGNQWGLALEMWLRLVPALWRQPRSFVRYQFRAVQLLQSRRERRQ